MYSVLGFIIIAVLIIIVVHFMIKSENFTVLDGPNFPTKYDFHKNIIHPVPSGCPVKDVEDENLIYLKDYLLGERVPCPLPSQTIDQFNKNFFDFRDKYTYQNSSMHEDPVDFIQNLYLSGNLDEARMYPNMKIKDIFDSATQGINLYERSCVRIPEFDNAIPDGYRYNAGTPGTLLTRDKWRYKNEKVMNGGEINNTGLHGYVPDANKYLEVDALAHAIRTK